MTFCSESWDSKPLYLARRILRILSGDFTYFPTSDQSENPSSKTHRHESAAYEFSAGFEVGKYGKSSDKVDVNLSPGYNGSESKHNSKTRICARLGYAIKPW